MFSYLIFSCLLYNKDGITFWNTQVNSQLFYENNALISNALIVRCYPLFLPAAGDFGCGDRAVETVDMPAAFGGVFLDSRMREHRQHELAFDPGEDGEQLLEIGFVERPVVVAAVGADIRGIHEVEGPFAIVTPDQTDTILAFDSHMVEAAAQLLGEGFLRVAEFLGRRAAAVVAERPVDHRCEAQLRADPYGPCPLDGCEERWVRVDMPGVCMNLAAVERGVDQLLQGRILRLGYAVEVDQFGVRVVDDLALDGLLGEENRAPAAEGFGVERMFGDERQDMLQQHLLAAIVGDRSFHRFGYRSFIGV